MTAPQRHSALRAFPEKSLVFPKRTALSAALKWVPNFSRKWAWKWLLLEKTELFTAPAKQYWKPMVLQKKFIPSIRQFKIFWNTPPELRIASERWQNKSKPPDLRLRLRLRESISREQRPFPWMRLSWEVLSFIEQDCLNPSSFLISIAFFVRILSRLCTLQRSKNLKRKSR